MTLLGPTFSLPVSFNLHGALNLAAAVFNLTVALIVLLNNPRSSVQRSFFYFSLSSSIWVAGYGLLSLSVSESASYFWFAVSYAGVCNIPPTLFQFSRRLLRISKFEHLTIGGYVAALIFSGVMARYKEQLCGITLHSWGKYTSFPHKPASTLYFVCLMVFFVVFISAAYFNFFLGYRRASGPTEKKQFRNILLGFSVGYLGMLDFAVTRGLALYPIGYLALTCLIATIAYSIARYQLWDINLIFKRVSLFSVLYVFLLSFILPLAFFTARAVFQDRSIAFVATFVLFSAAFGAVLSLGPLLYALIVRHSYWMKSHATSGITHELKSPISAIQSAVDIIQDQLKAGAGDDTVKTRLRPYVEMVEKNGNRLAKFVADLLSIAQIQDGLIMVEKQSVALIPLVEEVLDQYRALAAERNVRFREDFPRSLATVGDAEKLRQVFSNIVGNAVKYSDNSNIDVQLSKRGEHAIVQVKDEGKGIPRKDLSRIFDRFYTGHHSGRGAGLGLAIAKGWVEAHGGRIWAESEGEGKGTTVTFTLPAVS